jgi:hypothetical protein
MGTLYIVGRTIKMVSILWKAIWQFLKILNVELFIVLVLKKKKKAWC